MKSIAVLFIAFFTSAACASTVKSETIYKDGDFQVEVEKYSPRKSGSLDRTVVIFPPTGGVNRIDRSYARQFAKAGAEAIIIVGYTGQSEKSLELSIHQRLHERAIKAYGVVESNIPEGNKISVLGTSVGGLFASIVASQYSRPDTVLVIAGGAPIPEIIAHSDEEALAKAREQRMKKFGFKDKQEYADAIKEVFTLDPLNWANGFQEKRLGLVILNEDTTVHTRYQRRLLEHWKTPHVLERDNSHFWGIVYTWTYNSDKVVRFVTEGTF